MMAKGHHYQWLRAVLAAFVCVFIAVGAFAQNSADAFNEANRLYEQQKFPEAATAYEKLLHDGQLSAAVYFNLGNAYFKMGNHGRAIAAYRQAERLSPRDADIRANLQFARNEANSKFSESGWQLLLNRMTVNEWTTLTVVFFWLLFIMQIIGQWRPALKGMLRTYSIVFTVLFVLFATGLAFAVEKNVFQRSAVIVSQESVVRHGPFDESQSFYTLGDGAEVGVIDQRSNWVEVVDASNRTGWVKDTEVTIVPGR